MSGIIHRLLVRLGLRKPLAPLRSMTESEFNEALGIQADRPWPRVPRHRVVLPLRSPGKVKRKTTFTPADDSHGGRE